MDGKVIMNAPCFSKLPHAQLDHEPALNLIEHAQLGSKLCLSYSEDLNYSEPTHHLSSRLELASDLLLASPAICLNAPSLVSISRMLDPTSCSLLA